ncbi:hypothetical protein [Porphyromonas circumdentaria]|uniref:Uncharacterized protein n=1 Tax=Porphyromonas circumdentaria TaxID=29524 RepID=A0A1T4KQW7_9PORP|nr:hypothetical protein [Porphyromonas circumdentaria]MBB6274940.1 hypothetical protein [Porphyromonas circumdentaria]MDO4722227.1 hypothetical protein [Porphyromonas circumdentaria]SJZ44792.1 hypothetical protein SAMN02745171_00152 [Porphyromonas circumdentaria]
MNNNPNNEPFEYDDTEAVSFIRTKISEPLAKKLSDDEIYYFLDLITEYYESRGVFEEFEEESDESFVSIDLNDIADFIIKNAARDQIGEYTEQEVLEVVEAEMEFCGFNEVEEE